MTDSNSDDEYTGRPTDESTKQKIVQEAAKQALRKYNLESDEEHYRVIVEIQGSKSSFCTGYSHRIKLLLGKSPIEKGKMSPANFDKNQQFDEMAGSESERIVIVAICEDCDENGDDVPQNPCKFITLSKNVWQFDSL